jgi:hypothetical protein
MYRPAARACGLFEAKAERQQPWLAECEAGEGNTDGKIVSGESGGHDQIRKTREIGDVRRRRGWACRTGFGRRGKQCGPASRCRIHNRVQLLRSEQTLDSRSDQWQTVIADGCIAVVLETSLGASRLNKAQRPGFGRAPSARAAVKRLERSIKSSMVLG